MIPEEHLLFTSGFYSIHNFRCSCYDCNKSKREFICHFSVCFIRKGHFLFHTYNKDLDAYSGLVLVNKPGYEYNVTHPTLLTDECTIIRFTDSFYEQVRENKGTELSAFLNDPGQQSLLLPAKAGTLHLHWLCLHAIQKPRPSKLEADVLVMEIINAILYTGSYGKHPAVPDGLKKQHLHTIETAISFMQEFFMQDISLTALAAHCHVSLFHFSRLFKTFTGYSPYQYLKEIRLKQAAVLLVTGIPVADAAFSSGFNSLDYFSAAFHKQYGMAPTVYRRRFSVQQEF